DSARRQMPHYSAGLATLRSEPYRYFRSKSSATSARTPVIVQGFVRYSVPIPRSLVKMSRLPSGVSRGLYSRRRIDRADWQRRAPLSIRSEEHTSELQSLRHL